MSKTRVLVAEDSPTVRDRFCTILRQDPRIELVGEAADGREAIDLCARLRPDVISMDMMLPVMTGVAATEYIMAHCPTPILIVSSSFNRGEIFKTYDALNAGAVDAMEKPTGEEPEGEWEGRYLSNLRVVSRVRVVTRRRPRVPDPLPSADQGAAASVIGIGASTGGPNAIVEVLNRLPEDFSLPILLVMHINQLFGTAFAEWLDHQTPRRAAFAREGDIVASAAGQVILAPPDQHMIVRDGRIRLNREPERHSCRPSVDVLFESMAREYGHSVAAALLTGMGRDGASGLLAIRQAGGTTLSQDEASCVVYGMPREAELLGASMQVLPVEEIGPALGRLRHEAVRRVR